MQILVDFIDQSYVVVLLLIQSRSKYKFACLNADVHVLLKSGVVLSAISLIVILSHRDIIGQRTRGM